MKSAITSLSLLVFLNSSYQATYVDGINQIMTTFHIMNPEDRTHYQLISVDDS